MMMVRLKAFICLLVLVFVSLLVSFVSAAETTPQAGNAQPANAAAVGVGKSTTARRVALDNRVIVFPFDEHGIYEIKTLVERFTRVALSKDEVVRAFYLSDTARWTWHISQDKRDVLIKPHEPDLNTTATLKTNLRTYDLDISSGSDGSVWYQRVAWDAAGNMGKGIFEDEEGGGTQAPRTGMNTRVQIAQGAPAAAAAGTGKAPVAKGLDDEDAGVISDLPCGSRSMAAARLNYEAEGDEAFKPRLMFDDGRHTCLKMPEAMQDLPSLFVLSPKGEADIVDHKYRDGWLIVPKVMTHGGLLLLGEQKVTITNKTAQCGWFGSACKPSNLAGQNTSEAN
jgi:type IV secretion system protein TrbG